jgi:hypothetical protein
MVTTLILIWCFYDGFWVRRLKTNPKSSAQHYLDYIKEKKNKWLYYSYIMSILHALGCCYFVYIALFSCEVPPKYSVSGTLGNTFIYNEYCVDNASLIQGYGICFFLAYLTVDLVLCYFFIRDTSAGAMQNYIHHFLGIFGSVSGLLCGRMILTLSCATLVTELSTPFVSLRALLSAHKKTNTTLYLANGLMMTFAFFVCRVLFQPWITISFLWPAVVNRPENTANMYPLTRYYCYFSIFLYVGLCVLNFFWFYKMASGLVKFLMKAPKPAKAE